MDFDANIEHLRMAYWNILLTAGPVLLVALAVGLVIGILQAATSINEATLSFVPKMAIVIVTMALMSGFMLSTMTDYFTHVFDAIATMH
ncbi:Flagellar biosynthetic protein FliQ [Roseovarius sp. EC-HK134]|jgi:flagellar biosynthetic protein FliQ|uniref:Flagellar biosynthetic protein FliQ n=1 Tax=Roseovarius mucosus TaxID=215743 RepID=A0A1V0RLY5_9RHOB|nr:MULTISPECIES: flagellar biosynthesis protein FliQ [Roseovarius]ARE82789.1 flagellar biosynthesis protein FliQ [Roseovarius mucosus]AWZ18959.1 Flagellar biosynthesis protein FliQ [Roseovarius sp. AK1035]EDM33133.1 Flagellar protein FliQ [Roseovarius sp. TM1035]MBW4973497.1 flagellar biosynthesis protein FliQ [Roseovarius mucosus]VVT01947.1 Flagellar biosynthetic protein FliQ [Roseovarius sp. EC-HK134]|tara:strand:+ start:240 stop:506 length:267 start_codon:yes stop_codon:yes gene_type:complete